MDWTTLIALKRHPEIEVYTQDGLHPTVEGSYLAALVIVEQVAGIKPLEIPVERLRRLTLPSGPIEIPASRVAALRQVAAEANREHGLPAETGKGGT